MRVGIVGCGLIGWKRSAALGGDAEVRIVADINTSKAKKLAESLGIPDAAGDYRRVTLHPDVDAVLVAATHDALAEISLSAVTAGKHVLVEKPAARNVRELLPVITAAKKKGVVVKVGFNHRFHPAFQKAKELADSGALGPLMFIRGRYGHGGRIGYEKEWRADPGISGGGELLDQGTHLIDLARWFLGDLGVAGGALKTFFWNIPVDDNAFVHLESPSGQVAWLHASWTEWKNMFSFEIYGRDAKLQIEGLGGSYGVERLQYYRMKPEMGPPDTETFEFPGSDTSWEREFDDFRRAVAEGSVPCGTLDDARAALEIVETLYNKGT